MKIFLVRHAKSSWNKINLDDHERPLSKRGISDAILMRKYLIGLNVNFEKILCSSSVRTKQTLDLLIDNIDLMLFFLELLIIFSKFSDNFLKFK